MRRIKQLKTKLLITAVYCCVLGVFWLLDLPCVFVRIFGVECAGCGMSRAIFAALRFDFASAFSYHPMFWTMPILYLYFLYDGKLLGKKQIDYGFLIFCALGFLINWITNLC